MKCDAHDPLAFVATSAPYALCNSSFISSATDSSASGWSDAASHSTDDAASTSANTSDSDSADSRGYPRSLSRAHVETVAALRRPLPQREAELVPPELRLNTHRTAAGNHGRLAAPPVLVRHSDRRINFVDNLVDLSTQIVEAVWPLSVVCRNEPGSKTVLSLRTFIQETLRRSRTSYSTLQVALYYIILVKLHVPKHNFTTEQPDDRVADRALQCGRRMFLSALILASKYLQDRNYSARVWSKISGLNTHEINQNEMAFLLAVNWRLHIADDVFQRWTDIVLKCTPPPSPPSPDAASHAVYRTADWKYVILRLDPELTNVESLTPAPQPGPGRSNDLSILSPRSILNLPQEPPLAALAPKPLNVPASMEPAPTSAFAACRPAPALGLLPTLRLTPQTSGICTPAVSAASQILAKGGAMSMAMAHASCLGNSQSLDRFPYSVTSSPQVHCPIRRSSLANSVSTASSPESMMSDSSRSSSTSSVSSLASATHYNGPGRCSVPSRFRVARLWSDRVCAKPTVPSVPEDHDEWCLSASTETYSGPVEKLSDLSLDTPLARRERELDAMARDAVSDAARTLQDLHNHGCSADSTPTARVGCKRSRTASSSDNALQDNVRDILCGRRASSASAWPEVFARPRDVRAEAGMQFPARPTLGGTGKRVCYSVEAASAHPVLSLWGAGMWDGILN